MDYETFNPFLHLEDDELTNLMLTTQRTMYPLNPDSLGGEVWYERSSQLTKDLIKTFCWIRDHKYQEVDFLSFIKLENILNVLHDDSIPYSAKNTLFDFVSAIPGIDINLPYSEQSKCGKNNYGYLIMYLQADIIKKGELNPVMRHQGWIIYNNRKNRVTEKDITPDLFGDFPLTLEYDMNNYPDEAQIKKIEEASITDGDVNVGANWLVYVLPKIIEKCIYGGVRVWKEEDEVHIEIVTQGWSGVESIVESLIANLMLRVMYYSAWKRGGVHTFSVPLSFVDKKILKILKLN